jgi:hypothetical protein
MIEQVWPTYLVAAAAPFPAGSCSTDSILHELRQVFSSASAAWLQHNRLYIRLSYGIRENSP